MSISHVLGGPGPLLLLLAALAVNGYAAGPLAPFLPPGPVTLATRLGHWLDRKLNRPERGDTTRLARGALVVTVLGVAAMALGGLIHLLARALPYGWSLEGLALLACLQVREPWERVRSVRRALVHQGSDAARAAVSGLTRRDPAILDDHAIGRAAIEAVAKHLNQGVVTPAFWYVLLGLPGVLLWAMLNGLDEAIGHRSPRYEHFGRLAARACDVLNVLPARLTGLMIVAAAAFLGSAKPIVALKTLIKDARYHRSLNAGWPEAAMAGALGLALGGPYRQGEVTVREVWIGQGRARATSTDIDRALALHALTCLVFAGLVGVLMLVLAAL